MKKEPTGEELLYRVKSKEEAQFIIEKVAEVSEKLRNAQKEIGKVFLGQEDVVRLVFAGAVARGNVLSEGVPGLGKTLLVSNMAEVLGLSFNRIQFTSDMMPSDILGTEMQDFDDEGKRYLRFIRGPIFAQFILADEINRTPPKTQSALLEAMQEQKVSVQGKSIALQLPFLVMATQNPIESDGVYPLPEAQRDRFMIQAQFDYPEEEAEKLIAVRKASTKVNLREAWERSVRGEDLTVPPDKEKTRLVTAVLDRNDLVLIQELAKNLPVPDKVVEAAVQITRRTRPKHTDSDYIRDHLQIGAGPRASEAFTQMAQAMALLRGELSPNVGDVLALVKPIIDHRVDLKWNAQADKDSVMERVYKELTRGI